MTTPGSDVFDFFLSTVDDFRVDAIYSTSGSMAMETYLTPFLMNSVNDFDMCDQDLTYTEATDDIGGYFDTTLTMKNKLMLSQIMTMYWLKRELLNAMQIKNLLNSRDFKRTSEGSNITSKRMLYNEIAEEVAQRLNNYGWNDNSWSSWRDQVYY